MQEVRARSNGHQEDWVVKEKKRIFSAWLKNQMLSSADSMEAQTIRLLASGPPSTVTSWQAYDINGYTFYTTTMDNKSVAYQNSGIRIEAVDVHDCKVCYYGLIDDIWELNNGQNL